MSDFKFSVGDRVDWSMGDGSFQNSTPGTVAKAVIIEGSRKMYRVNWDDGFVEDATETNANLWDEENLVHWQGH